MRARAGLAAFVAAFAFIAGPAAGAAELVGSARVIDGDTLAVSGTVVRLHGIDAPETGQSCSNAAGRAYACGEAATEALARLVAGGKVACQGNTRDRYDRLVAVCRTRGAELNRAMVAGGWAAAFRHYSDDYATDEADARAARRGMWAGSFQMPWDYRAQAWALAAAAAPRPGCPIKGNISAAGRVYHTPYSRSYDRTRINPARGERWFCSEDEALAAGWRAPVR